MNGAMENPVVSEQSSMTMATLLEQLAGDNPRMRLILELARQQEAAAAASQQGGNAGVQRTGEQYERLRSAYIALRDRVTALADALGACARCWGDDPLCGACAGAGTPGWHAPDEDAFRAYIVPAARRARIEWQHQRGTVADAMPPRHGRTDGVHAVAASTT